MPEDHMKLFCGNAVPELAHAVANTLGVEIGQAKVGRFSDGEINVEIMENVRGKDTIILQSTGHPSNDHLMELVLMADALRAREEHHGHRSLLWLCQTGPPHSSASQSRPKSWHVIASVGINHALIADLHAEQIQVFQMPVDNVCRPSSFCRCSTSKP